MRPERRGVSRIELVRAPGPSAAELSASSDPLCHIWNSAGITLFIATVYVGINFVVDLLYGVIDPRIRVR